MSFRNTEVAVVGAGAAGVAAARRLHDAGLNYVLLEAKPHIGGRALTFMAGEFPIDLGCGWLHSADRNPWVKVAQKHNFSIDKSPPPWERLSNPVGFPLAEQKEFRKALNAFYERADTVELNGSDPPLSQFLEAGERWNPLINAVSTYFSGAELEHVSTRDLRAYNDSEENWRVAEGYGAVVTKHGEGLNVILNCTVETISWGGKGVSVHTSVGSFETEAAIVTLPTSIIAQQPDLFDPPLNDKTEAAAGLPLGLADKLFLSLAQAEEFEKDSRLFGHKDRTVTAIYHLRPLGRPLIECYFGGDCAQNLESGGAAAFFDFATSELVSLLGSNFATRVRPLPMKLWRTDPFARGSYSYALPGRASCRAILGGPVAEKLYFAGEACSPHEYSTAHGAYETGVAAAEAYIAAHALK